MSGQFVPADFVRWEVEYADGTVVGEQDGLKYGGIDRNNLKKFKLINEQGSVLFETWPPPGATGHQFVYRRRTKIMEGGQKMILFVVGWVPDGPAFAVNVEDGSYRMSEHGFSIEDPDMYPPEPMPGEAWFKENQSQ